MESIGEKIANLRKDRGASQEELAFALHVSRQTISRWERGTAKPTVENLESLTKFFGINSDYFLSEEVTASNNTEEVETVEKEDSAPVAEGKKVHKLKTLKIMALVAVFTLLAFCAVACGIAAYVACAPVQGQEVVSANSFNIEGIIFVCVGLFSFVLLVALTVLCIINGIRANRNRRYEN